MQDCDGFFPRFLFISINSLFTGITLHYLNKSEFRRVKDKFAPSLLRMQYQHNLNFSNNNLNLEMEESLQKLHLSSGNISTLYTYDTEFSADSVEWCPHQPHQNFFVCANYQLTEDEPVAGPRKRLGRILLFSISSKNGLKLWQILNTAAVLDQKWCHNRLNSASILGVVNAEKKIEIYSFNPEKFTLELITLYQVQSDVEVLLLSLDWSTGKYSSQEPNVVCSDSKGGWHLFNFDGTKLILESTAQVHDYEAWIAAFYYWDTNIFFTGGDDSRLFKFDTRIGTNPILQNKSHNAGVTCIHSNVQQEHIIATGSYDEFLRLWDIRKMKSPVNELKMPGPLWRVKWDPFRLNFLLIACMLGGAHVVDGNNSENLKIIESYYEHKNITYGADWSYLSENEVSKFKFDGNRIIGTCSFYDHLLCVSKLTIL